MSRSATPQELYVARTVAADVRRHGQLILPVDELLAEFGVSRLTDASRDRLTEALDQAGVICEPPIRLMSRGGRLKLTPRQPVRLAAPARPPAAQPPRAADERPWYERKRAWAAAAVLLVLLIGTLGGQSNERATDDAQTAEGTSTATPSAAEARAAVIARAESRLDAGRYSAALNAVRGLDEPPVVRRYRKRIAQRILREVRSDLRSQSYRAAIRGAELSRRFMRTATATRLVSSAEDGIEERQAAIRLARDRRTCDSAEKDLVRYSSVISAGCSGYADQLAEEAARAAARAERAAADAAPDCHPDYAGACLDPEASDYDCAGGEGDGPKYTGQVTVTGSDPYELNADPENDDLGCEPY